MTHKIFLGTHDASSTDPADPVDRLLGSPDHVAIYRDRVEKIHGVVTTGYLFARYIFVPAHDDALNVSQI